MTPYHESDGVTLYHGDYLQACGLSLDEIGRMLDAEMQSRRERQVGYPQNPQNCS